VEKIIKAVIFDLGGVLIRTIDHAPRVALANQLHTTREELEQLIFLSHSSIKSEMGIIPFETHWNWVMSHFDQKEIDPAEIFKQFFSGDILDLELMAFIKKIRKKYKTGLLSNAWQNSRNALGMRYSFLEDFDATIFSSEVGSRKPDHRIFFEIFDQLEVQPQESIFVDDAKQNVDAARKLGMHAILFTNTEELINEISSFF
jgi:epoxide hydrolase-like predicted phosphatase